ncbi:MAG: hypothetical protein M3046_10645 [Actinomycetota bacterium]|nr:hypothetical protein [Actinomycetota bacterium]
MIEQVRVGRELRRFVTAVGVAGIVIAVSAQPAAAHSVGGVEASNFETSVKGLAPPVPGLTVEAVDLGNELELRNDTGVDVIVPGYQSEPYLRVGPRGVFENRRSPAAYLNRTRDGKTRVPSYADPASAPDWHKIGSGLTARWHDHRAHWMGTSDPPEVARDPGHRHVVDRWRVGLQRGSQTITVRGELVWVPAPSPWGWLAGSLVAAAALVALSRTRRWPSLLAIALAIVVLSETAHVIGQWTASAASFGSKLSSSVYSIGGVALAVIALVWILVRPPSHAIPAVLFAGLVVTAAGGLADLTLLTHSQLPTDLPDGIARLQVAIALGFGIGLAAAAALRLRPPPPTSLDRKETAEPLAIR